jgi:hypothetical protein
VPAIARASMIGATPSIPFLDSGNSRLQSGDRARWRVIADRTVYFGHQSVGDDITAGLDALNDELTLGLRLVQTRHPSAIAQPAFVHFHAGRNGDPASKNAAMLKLLAARPRADNATIVLKYCYVDVGHDTDVSAVFAAYQGMVRLIRLRHPDVTIVHATVPVTTVEDPMKARVKELLGRRSVRQDAIARHRYNELMRAAYAGREPLLDIARVEAMRANGDWSTFASGNQQIETLALENTRDGGHLNPRGQRMAAKGLLNALALALEGGS